MLRNQVFRLSWGRRERGMSGSNLAITLHDSFRLLLFGVVLLLVLATSPVEGGVNLKNGNFYIAYTDISSSGLKVTRTYNSKATSRGMFGYGWGSPYETYLTVSGDGAVVMHENGSGAQIEFRPPYLSSEEIQKAVDIIMRVAKEDGRFRDNRERRRRREELLQNAYTRRTWWTRYTKKGLLEPRHLAPGTVYRAQAQQRLLRTHTGFQRIQGHRVDEFDARGRLIRTVSGDGAIVYLFRDHRGYLSRIVNQAGKTLHFHMNNNGTVARIDSSTGQRAIYHYAGDRLSGSMDAGDNRYTYRYDRKANMIAIGYQDGTQMIMTYEGTEYGGSQFVRSITEPNETTTWYEYVTIYDRPDGKYYTTKKTQVSPDGDRTVTLYEYWIVYLNDGSSYTQRTRVTLNNDFVLADTSYAPDGSPVQKRQGSKSGNFKYDERGRLITKWDGEMIIHLSYNDQVDKISEILEYPASKPDDKKTSQFDYDTNGRLVAVSNNEGERFHLDYDNKGQIIQIEHGNAVLSFAYNTLGKPETIVLKGVGALRVTYNDEGKIQSVDTDAAEDRPAIAESIVQTFNSLLSLVRPAGVDFDLF